MPAFFCVTQSVSGSLNESNVEEGTSQHYIAQFSFFHACKRFGFFALLLGTAAEKSAKRARAEVQTNF